MSHLDIKQISDALLKRQHIKLEDPSQADQDLNFFIKNFNLLIDDYNLIKDNNKSIETLLKLLQDTTNKLEKNINQFTFFQRIAQKGINDLSMNDLFESLMEIINDETEAQFSAFVLFDSITYEFTNIFTKNIFDNSRDINTLFPMWEEIIDQIKSENKIIFINNTSEHSLFENHDIPSFSIIALPLYYNEEIFGVLFIGHRKQDFFPDDIISILNIISKQISIIIKNRMVQNQYHISPSSLAETILSSMNECLFVLDTSMNIISINNSVISSIGEEYFRLIKNPFLSLIANDDERNTLRTMLIDLLDKNIEIQDFRCSFKRPDNTGNYYSLSASLIKDIKDENNAIVIIARDISKSRFGEKQLKKAYKDKEILLNELYHRVNNNFQIIIGLLNLQERVFKDKNLKSALFDTQHRIQTIAFVHKLLYSSNSLSNINIKQYISDLTNYLFSFYKKESLYIKVFSDIENINLDISYAIPIGLILNELITNAIKYAFKGMSMGIIKIRASIKNNSYKFTIIDNGIGLPDNFEKQRMQNIGYNLIDGLIQQVNGKINIYSKNGTIIEFSFPCKAKNNNIYL